MLPDSSIGRLEDNDLSKSGMASRSPDSEVLDLFPKTSQYFQSQAHNPEDKYIFPDASTMGQILLSCRLSIPDAGYRSLYNKLEKDGLFGYACALRGSAKGPEPEPSKPASEAAFLTHPSTASRLTESWCFHSPN